MDKRGVDHLLQFDELVRDVAVGAVTRTGHQDLDAVRREVATVARPDHVQMLRWPAGERLDRIRESLDPGHRSRAR